MGENEERDLRTKVPTKYSFAEGMDRQGKVTGSEP